MLALAWSDDDRRAVVKAMHNALRGVGDTDREHLDLGAVALHLRRAMTPAEFKGLPRRGGRFPIELAGEEGVR